MHCPTCKQDNCICHEQEIQRVHRAMTEHSLNADSKAIHESLQRQREQRTKRVKSILP